MGIVKFLLILVVCLGLGGACALFMSKNAADVAVDMVFLAEPLQMTAGELSGYSFLIGIVAGLLLCLAYIAVQWVEIGSLKRKLKNQLKQLDAVNKGFESAGSE